MIYFAVGLALLGTAIGLVFRWKVLLPIIILVPFAAVVFSVARGASLETTVIIVLAAEAILQGGYFLGLLIRFLATAGKRLVRPSSLIERGHVPETRDNDRHPAPPTQPGSSTLS
ncbi:conserved membrane hypothetical protein [Bradyrhizobium sp. STM 3843]|uniref:hypothetical protein n=1 Tax=Bradyrhizobium sp. STM 3843 TaxID=551947 RepID=UPI0002404398|nr:hypothetical protein [Bradyrhizobium sp. STM 3843]CCE10421.1 conserved membrane hypothetical protein [Bradyrhizobium sp. STM 3843]